jgi:DNA-binding transcriptional ArsR family regulator
MGSGQRLGARFRSFPDDSAAGAPYASTLIEASRRRFCYRPANQESPVSHLPSVAGVASLIADPARAAMLMALLDGRALPAGELAYAGGVTAQTASSHLAKLLDGGLVAVESEGRHRYYRLAGAHIAQALEQLAAIRPAEPVKRKALSPQGRELRFARCCYDHLAGQLGHGKEIRGDSRGGRVVR